MSNEEMKQFMSEFDTIIWEVSKMTHHCSPGFEALWAIERHMWVLYGLLNNDDYAWTMNNKRKE